MTTINLASLRILVIDDMLTVRQTIKTMLLGAGMNQLEFASSVGEARKRIQTSQFDLVLCDFHMGNGVNGQDFLEEIRHTGTLPLETSFLMVTAESSYEKVVSVAEVAPDDYLLKPFSVRDLIERVARSVNKKNVLRDLYRAVQAGEVDSAMQIGKGIMQHSPRFKLDAARLLAQLLNDTGRIDDATELYVEILESKAVPWARLGMAGVHAKQGNKKEAAAIYQDLLDKTPNFVEVYDRLAQHYLDEGQEDKAIAIMERAVAITPNNISRLQTAGQLAFRLGNSELAQNMLKRAVVAGGNSTAFNPRVLYSLLLIACQEGRARDADQYLGMLVDFVEKSSDETLRGLLLLARAAKAVQVGKHDHALEMANVAVNHVCEGPLDNDHAFDLFALCSLLPANSEVVPNWVKRVTGRYSASRQTSERLRIALKTRPDWAEQSQAESQRVQSLANEGMAFVVHNQEYGRAAEFLFAAAMETRNPRLIRNAFSAATKGVSDKGEPLSHIVEALTPMMAELEAVRT